MFKFIIAALSTALVASLITIGVLIWPAPAHTFRISATGAHMLVVRDGKHVNLGPITWHGHATDYGVAASAPADGPASCTITVDGKTIDHEIGANGGRFVRLARYPVDVAARSMPPIESWSGASVCQREVTVPTVILVTATAPTMTGFTWPPRPLIQRPDLGGDLWCVRDAFCALMQWSPYSSERSAFIEAPNGIDIERLAAHLGLMAYFPDTPPYLNECIDLDHPGIIVAAIPAFKTSHAWYEPDLRSPRGPGRQFDMFELRFDAVIVNPRRRADVAF